VRTPSGLLGLISFALLLIMATGGYFFATNFADSQNRTECIARELAGPWVGLRESFSAPPGDAVARQRALDAIVKGIDRLEHLDEHC